MANIPQKHWKAIAWNGIRFESPIDWEIGMIGTQYLMLENNAEPVFEIKWGQIKGPFSPQTTLRRLAGNQTRHMGLSARECPLPEQWKKPLDTYETTGFLWQGKSFSGNGVILYCPVCRNATLIQFYHKTSMAKENLPERLLASFRDHPNGNRVEWKVFDIRATIPKQFKLVHHCFESGTFEMAFASDGQKITLYRFGPASILLRKNSLAELAANVTGQFHPNHRLIIHSGHQAVEGEIRISAGRWQRWFYLIKGHPSIQWVRFWHVAEKNRILGIRAEGKRPFSSDFLKQICADYESL